MEIKMRVLARFKEVDLVAYPFPLSDLSILLIGQNVLNNRKAIRCNDPETGDIVFYEVD